MSQFDSTPMTPPITPGELPEKKSSWPVVIGVIAIVFGLLGAAGGCMNTASPLFMNAATSMMESAAQNSSDPQAAEEMAKMKAMFDAAKKYQAATMAVGAAALIAGLMLLGGGVGLCLRAPWSRTLCLFWSFFKVAVVFISGVVGYLAMQAQLEAMKDMGGAPPGAMAMGTGLGVVGMVVGVIWGLVLPIFMLVWFNRGVVKTEVAQWGELRDQRI